MESDMIAKSIKDRDENGIRELLRHSEPLIRYIIRPIIQDEEEQKECLSDIIMKVWDHIDSFDPERGTWNAWVTALARNTALNRARQKKATLSMDEISENIISDEPTPEEHMLLIERRNMLRMALMQISDRDRALFYRKYYYMQSTAQIASELGMTERAVEGKLYRIKKKLRELLGGEGHA